MIESDRFAVTRVDVAERRGIVGTEALGEGVLHDRAGPPGSARDRDQTRPRHDRDPERDEAGGLVERTGPHERDGPGQLDHDELRGELGRGPGREEARDREDAAAAAREEGVHREGRADQAQQEERHGHLLIVARLPHGSRIRNAPSCINAMPSASFRSSATVSSMPRARVWMSGTVS